MQTCEGKLSIFADEWPPMMEAIEFLLPNSRTTYTLSVVYGRPGPVTYIRRRC